MKWWGKVNPTDSIAIFKSHAGTDFVLLQHLMIFTGNILTFPGHMSWPRKSRRYNDWLRLAVMRRGHLVPSSATASCVSTLRALKFL